MLRSIFLVALFLSSCLLTVGQEQPSTASPLVHSLNLNTVHALSTAEQRRIVQDILNQVGTRRYRDDREFFDEIAERVRFEFQTLGYFKVFVKEPAITVIRRDDDRKVVDIDIHVNEGDQYRLKQIRFKNGAVFSSTELRAAFPIADGDILDRTKIGSGLERLRRAYAEKGYVNFSAVPETNLDEAAHSLSLDVDIDEGSLFHVGTLTVLGVESEPGARDRLLSKWNSYLGKVFDYRMLQQFLNDVGARPEVQPDQIFQISQDANAKVVNVSMTLVKPPVF